MSSVLPSRAGEGWLVRLRMRLALVACLFLAGAGPAAAQPVATPDTAAQAYFEFLQARRFESQNNPTAALEALTKAVTLDPKSAELQAELAGFYARQDKAAESVAAADKALAIDPNNLEAHRMLGLVFAVYSDGGGQPLGGRTPAQMRALAIDHLSKILDTPTVATDLNIQLTLARLHLRANGAAKAVPILENIISQAPFAAEPHQLLAEARLNLGRVDSAIEAMETAAEINPRYRAPLAELYERQGRWQDAANAYAQSLAAAKGGSNRDLRLRYATALLNTADEQSANKARDVLKDFLMTSPQDTRGLFLLSSASLRLGDLTTAETVARKLVAADPAGLQGLHALSAALVARREYRQVIDLLTPLSKDVGGRAKGRESDAALLLSQLGHAHTELGEHAQAVAILTTAVNSDPQSAPALNSLGYTLADRGERLDDAVAYIERALKVDPENPSYLDSLGWALFKQGRAEAAEPFLQKAADALPEQSVILDHLGEVLARRGKYQDAVVAWERALKGDGEDIDRSAIDKKIRDAKTRKQ